MLSGPGKTGMFAICSAVALLLGSTAMARADGLPGGSCCADLEERVAELEATTARKGNRRVSLTISGQVTTGLLAWDDGEDSDIYVTDNTFSGGGTGVTFSGSATISPTLTAGFEIALGIATGARSQAVSQDDDDGGAPADSTFAMTRANWYLDHKQVGRLTVGRINTATAGVTGVDLGGASVVASGSSIGYWNAGFQATPGGKWGDLMGGGTVWGSGLSRANAISYTSPTFGGFQVSAAWGEDDMWDAALRYAGEHGDFRVAAAIGYIQNHSGFGDQEDLVFLGGDDELSQVKGSASIMHVPSGLYLTGVYLDQDGGDGVSGLDGDFDTIGRSIHDATLWYVQGGISKNWTGLGNTVLYGEYANIDASRTVFDPKGFGFFSYTADTDVWGLGVVQHVDAAAMELFLSYRNYSSTNENTPGPTFEPELDVVVSGARIRF